MPTLTPEQIDYNVPFTVRSIFKSDPFPNQQSQMYEDPILAELQEKDKPEAPEYDCLIMAPWSSIKFLQSYPYVNENDTIWTRFRDVPKFYIALEHGTHLVEGDFHYWCACWGYYKSKISRPMY